MDGILNLLKPAGMTSHDAVRYISRKLGKVKTGHTGTLDPMAVGVLPICIGKATRVSEYLLADDKKYRCEMQLGLETDTQDIWGKTISTSEVDVTEEQIRKAFEKFDGEIEQFPPKFSAIRVNGKRLYEYARNGIEVEIKPRRITIHKIEIVKIEDNKILFDVLCSKGTYVRTICHDIGIELGCGAAMSFLLRSKSGVFTVEKTITLEDLDKIDIEKHLYPAEYPLVNMGVIEINDENSYRVVSNGLAINTNRFNITRADMDGYNKIYYKLKFVGIGIIDKSKNEEIVKVKKVFI